MDANYGFLVDYTCLDEKYFLENISIFFAIWCG